MALDAIIEAVLFYQAEPTTFSALASLLSEDETAIASAVATLKETLSKRGIRLLVSDDTVALVTSPEASGVIEKLRKEEYSGELTKAAAETLAIILYQGPISRFEIDYLRGVNSAFTLRNLLIRGLIEKIQNPKDKRGFLFKTSPALLAHLGLTEVTELPEFDKVKHELDTFKREQSELSADPVL